ncbi:MAG: HD family phosphohydrolase [Leptodesmis sp.]|uniref:HD family phosphohydrolase n=1 Tax=Leptodesmis sp. TaxID=3100501 RepID=UPI003D133E52
MKRIFQALERQLKETYGHYHRRLSESVGGLDRYRLLFQRSPFSDRPSRWSTYQTRLRRSTPWRTVSHSPLVLGVAVISLTSVLGYRFYTTPKLDIGKAAPQTIYAPASVTIEDQKATEEQRKTARKDAISVLKLDQAVNQQAQRLLQQQLQQGTELRQLAGAFPFTKTAYLSFKTQVYLRKLPDRDWQALLTTVDPKLPQTSEKAGLESANHPPLLENDRKQAIAELRALRRSVDLGTYLRVVQETAQARLRYAAALTAMVQPAVPNLSQAFNWAVLDLSNNDWRQIQTHLPNIAEQILVQGIAPGLPESLLSEVIKLQVKGLGSPESQAIASQLLINILQPNLVKDEEQTRLRAEQVARGIQPVMVSVRKGESIVKSGQIISSANFALLDHFGLSRREIDWVGLIAFGSLVSGAVTIVWFVKQRFYPSLRKRDGILLWLLSLSTPLLVALRLPSTNLPAVGLLIGSFYGGPLGVTIAGLLALLMAVGSDLQLNELLSSAIGGLVCGWLGGRLRSREELAILGVSIGVLQGSLYLLLTAASGIVWYTLLGASVIQGLIGLTWVIVGMGSSPYLEQLFDLITTIRLVELANPNRPLLKRLASEAPGTFQHTLFVSTLAEAAARALGCNVELVRTGTLYHDIGKMHDPLSFIENQMGGPNKHDIIDNPWESAEIIKKHVTEGLVMARKFRLPKAIQAFIPEHQGTMVIAYFYHQAQQRLQQTSTNGSTPVLNDEDFKYDGPIPQSRETGIVMLADSCEAALRSLKNATPEEALSMINKILRARWQENQLVDSGLTRDEMTQIANVFVQVWQQFNHQRIAYPKLTPAAQPSKG